MLVSTATACFQMPQRPKQPEEQREVYDKLLTETQDSLTASALFVACQLEDSYGPSSTPPETPAPAAAGTGGAPGGQQS